MNIKPYEEKKNTDSKDTIYLRLISARTKFISHNDVVDLCIVDKEGLCSNDPILLSITNDMEVSLIRTENKLVSTDENGRIKVIN